MNELADRLASRDEFNRAMEGAELVASRCPHPKYGLILKIPLGAFVQACHDALESGRYHLEFKVTTLDPNAGLPRVQEMNQYPVFGMSSVSFRTYRDGEGNINTVEDESSEKQRSEAGLSADAERGPAVAEDWRSSVISDSTD